MELSKKANKHSQFVLIPLIIKPACLLIIYRHNMRKHLKYIGRHDIIWNSERPFLKETSSSSRNLTDSFEMWITDIFWGCGTYEVLYRFQT